MSKFYFESPIVIDSEKNLRKIFHNDLLMLEEGSVIKIVGEIDLGNFIEFKGLIDLGDGSKIGNGCSLKNVKIKKNNTIRPYSILENVKIGSFNILGPYCFVRDNCVIADSCILGAYLEVTRSNFDSGVKVSHHGFIGDAKIGTNTIIGAGTIFCNFDGKRHQKTSIGSKVIIGSGVLIIAPLIVESDINIGAGAVISQNLLSKDTTYIQKRSIIKKQRNQ